jgi:ribosome-binding ATPase YchF (GTP1/OBG family)
MELVLADLATVERGIERLLGQTKARPKQYADELAFLHILRQALDSGKAARLLQLTDREKDWIAPLSLLTAKPRLFVANVGEADLPDGNELSHAVGQVALDEGAGCVILCAQLEAALLEWSIEDAQAYRDELGLPRSGRDSVIETGYRLLNLITFFTATGTREVRAWAIPNGTIAIDAAGKIHSDIQRGFIRAEVCTFADLDRLGSFAAVKDEGRMRLEGRDYVVQDGDIIHFRFNI